MSKGNDKLPRMSLSRDFNEIPIRVLTDSLSSEKVTAGSTEQEVTVHEDAGLLRVTVIDSAVLVKTGTGVSDTDFDLCLDVGTHDLTVGVGVSALYFIRAEDFDVEVFISQH